MNSFGRYLFLLLLLLQSVITSKYRLGLRLLGEVSISEELSNVLAVIVL